MLKKVRQLTESVNDTLKGRLDLEEHGGQSIEGVALSLAHSPDGNLIATKCTKVQLWDAHGSGGALAAWLPSGVNSKLHFIDVQFSQCGTSVLACGGGGVLGLLSATNGRLLTT